MTVDLRAERINRGLSCREAARQMGVEYMALQRAERGTTRRPRPATALLIAQFYGYQVTDVWPLEEPSPA